MSREEWLVFGRTAYEEPLAQCGMLTSAAPRAALDRYGSDWLELVLIPESELHWITRAGEVGG